MNIRPQEEIDFIVQNASQYSDKELTKQFSLKFNKTATVSSIRKIRQREGIKKTGHRNCSKVIAKLSPECITKRPEKHSSDGGTICLCSVDNCREIVQNKNLCLLHLRRYDKHGDVLANVGKWKKRPGTYRPMNCGYPMCIDTGQKMHVKVMEEKLGRPLKGGREEVVHHIDMDKMNYNIDNLKLCTAKEHSKIHGQFNEIVPKLFQLGIVKFDGEKYYINEDFKDCIGKL